MIHPLRIEFIETADKAAQATAFYTEHGDYYITTILPLLEKVAESWPLLASVVHAFMGDDHNGTYVHVAVNDDASVMALSFGNNLTNMYARSNIKIEMSEPRTINASTTISRNVFLGGKCATANDLVQPVPVVGHNALKEDIAHFRFEREAAKHLATLIGQEIPIHPILATYREVSREMPTREVA